MAIPYQIPKSPIFLQWRFRAQPPNLIPANISGYMVYMYGASWHQYIIGGAYDIIICYVDLLIHYEQWIVAALVIKLCTLQQINQRSHVSSH